ncbi:type II toxin-antitoxin system RelE/ParE family toxin [Cellvibrio sp. KY-GH-1]|uniref:type II toxin-antitoxin system RelE/ParE family toxin n=1 Tax=Cellvibrio sp. KY-GH-1 TaxID=2303332 RepID=UPI00124664D4|nr:type II toxin-antitoxin system RelE/ParE family toxin [Cellvibrio sp. KY-GH-1]QEY17332.1 type II toxin-antitoxin system RelE/ParE family toxin [Cellvibrio sp. KY-GH-1]
MATIKLAEGVWEDFERILAHLDKFQVQNPLERIQAIIKAIDVLETNPLVGRPIDSIKRELVIGKDSQGYVALYHYSPIVDAVFILAVRSQRQAGYAR